VTSRPGLLLGVDLGGTSMRAALVDTDGVVHRRLVRPTPGTPDSKPLLALAAEAVEGASVSGAVVGVPGRVDYGAGRLEWAPNLPAGWADELREDALSDALGVGVALANDADLAAVGESWFGAGRDHRDVVYVTISTGIGGGVVNGGLLLHGRRSLAEIGHTVVDRAAAAAGRPATVEALGSGTALARVAAEAGHPIDGVEVVRRWRAGDPVATEIWESALEVAGLVAANVAQLFTPDVIVVGGGVGLVGEPVLDRMRRARAEHGPVGLPEPVEVVNATLGDDAGLAGAGAWHRAFRPAAASRG
jgi:glucokinase